MDYLKKKLVKIATSLELIIAFFIVVAIILGGISIVKYLSVLLSTDIYHIYDSFKKFLSIALLMVIGIELVLMLLSHSTGSILELVLFAIARKMLVYSETMLDLILGTIAILIVFLIRKYLMSSKYATFNVNEGKVVSAASPVHAVNFESGLSIPEDKGSTIGGLICHLSDETCKPVEEGAEYSVGGVTLKIVKMKDGLIEKVLLLDSDKVKEGSAEEVANHS
ncbi:transporter associated domain-containing protein [Alkaliphilus serpentinus]|uniref:Transporter-associated domain-containing protein n=1 Tax=Alkaliphilus serpentinus TaxID=1482731 RepID=A0A833HQL4_9FIRM|nr:transporter associated domain-containing protein [Alkaliphilus serpentinus]KAB3531861.1 hypothetical protein F8153_03850 [Alkaliphilus serpentinus]